MPRVLLLPPASISPHLQLSKLSKLLLALPDILSFEPPKNPAPCLPFCCVTFCILLCNISIMCCQESCNCSSGSLLCRACSADAKYTGQHRAAHW